MAEKGGAGVAGGSDDADDDAVDVDDEADVNVDDALTMDRKTEEGVLGVFQRQGFRMESLPSRRRRAYAISLG